MPQDLQYYQPSPIQPLRLSTEHITGPPAPTHSLTISEDFDTEKPVKIIDDEIEVNENLLEEDRVYLITYKGEQYYTVKSKGAIEIFQFGE
ncbi:MAG: hypothetical protein WCF03_07025 [Nitrososphaeraceae archaeon]